MGLTAPPGASGPPHGGARGVWSAGGTVFAGVLIIVNGILDGLVGITGLANHGVFRNPNHYTFGFNVTGWAWIHLIGGVLLVLVGLGVLAGAVWARAVGVVLAGLSVVVNFLWLPYHPFWGLIGIAIGIFVIWALCTYRDEPVV